MAHNVLWKFRSVAFSLRGAVCLMVCSGPQAAGGPQDTPLPAPRLAEEPPQVEADLRLAFRQIQRLTETDREQGLERFKRLLTQLEKDTVLPPERRPSVDSHGAGPHPHHRSRPAYQDSDRGPASRAGRSSAN